VRAFYCIVRLRASATRGGALGRIPEAFGSASALSSCLVHCPSRVGTGPETGGKIFDPYGFSTMGGDKALAFFRHAEIKHGRVAMAGVVGLLVHINHIHFDGYLSPTFGVSFADLSAMGPFDAWNAVPLLGQLQASAAPATADPCCVYLSTRAGGGGRVGGES
jgi:hypothetical protein